MIMFMFMEKLRQLSCTVLLIARIRIVSFYSTKKHSNKQTPNKIYAMEKLTLQQVRALRKAQEDLNFCKAVYLEFYPKIAKHAYTTELNNLIRGDFNRVDVQLNIPALPPQINQQEEYTPMLQVDKMIELYDAAVEGMSLL